MFAFCTPVSISFRGSFHGTKLDCVHDVPRYPVVQTRLRMSLLPCLKARAKEDKEILQSTLEKALHHSQRALCVTLIGLTLSLSIPDVANAAGSGGRIGGSSFRRSPGVTRMAPGGYNRGYGGYGYGGYGYGGYSPIFPMPGIHMSPFIAPIGGIGLGGGFGTLLLLGTAAAFVYNVASSPRSLAVDGDSVTSVDEKVAICTLKIGLLANARYMQRDLDILARSAQTGTARDLQLVLGECVVSLLKHPDYWAYASVNTEIVREWERAEGAFNNAALEQRLKIEKETLVNVGGRSVRETSLGSEASELEKAPSEYIVVSLVVAAGGNIGTVLPKFVDSESDVKRALKALGAVRANDLQALEILWAPQSASDTLTEHVLLQDHPDLRRL